MKKVQIFKILYFNIITNKLICLLKMTANNNNSTKNYKLIDEILFPCNLKNIYQFIQLKVNST